MRIDKRSKGETTSILMDEKTFPISGDKAEIHKSYHKRNICVALT